MAEPHRAPPDVDERGLLVDPPATQFHRGRLAGYDAGRRVRRGIAAVGALGFIAALCGYVLYKQHLVYQRLHPFQLPEGTDVDALPRTLHWSSGSARLVIKREVPGVSQIILPDRVLELADGCDRARVLVDVGTQISVEVLSGHVVQRPYDPSAHEPSVPGPSSPGRPTSP